MGGTSSARARTGIAARRKSAIDEFDGAQALKAGTTGRRSQNPVKDRARVVKLSNAPGGHLNLNQEERRKCSENINGSNQHPRFETELIENEGPLRTTLRENETELIENLESSRSPRAHRCRSCRTRSRGVCLVSARAESGK
jgi:hypothetical protein